MPSVLESFARLRGEADLVLVEGAGSASEINLRANDIANMGFARAADVPVVLIGDIDRGGVIASLVGTKAVLAPEDAALIGGFIVNKFRGDPALFADGMTRIAQVDRMGRRSGWCRFSPMRANCRRRMRWRSSSGGRNRGARRAHRGADPAAYRQFRRSRSARRGARRSRLSWCGRARRCRAMPIW